MEERKTPARDVAVISSRGMFIASFSVMLAVPLLCHVNRSASPIFFQVGTVPYSAVDIGRGKAAVGSDLAFWENLLVWLPEAPACSPRRREISGEYFGGTNERPFIVQFFTSPCLQPCLFIKKTRIPLDRLQSLMPHQRIACVHGSLLS